MTLAEKVHRDAIRHLTEARREMKKLASCTGDWTAVVLVEIGFDDLEETCREFGRCQFGLGEPTAIEERRFC